MNHKNTLSGLGYENHGLFQSFCEATAPFVVAICSAFFVFSYAQGWAHDRAAARCQDIAVFYGVAKDSPSHHRMLPEGVEIQYVSGSCVRTDDMTVVTGNEMTDR